MYLPRSFRVLIAVSVISAISGCTTVKRQAPPEHLAVNAKIPHIPRARYWGDETPPFVSELLALSDEEVQEQYPQLLNRKIEVLSISGGGESGAYTAGLMLGWTARGDRPSFMIVNGISTGAIVAPFVFLGPKYDDVLLELYSKYATRDAVKRRNLATVFASDALYDTAPLRGILRSYLTDDVIDEIAQEYRKGRWLLLGSVNLDLMRPVSWDLGRIAASDHPNKRDLILDIIMASSAIPCAFPPVLIDVEAEDRIYQEMHVDGGIYSQIITGTIAYRRDDVERKIKAKGTTRCYVIRNAKTEPEWKEVRSKIIPIAARSLSSMIRTQGLDNLKEMYLTAKRDGYEIYLTAIPPDFNVESKELFDPDYMNALIDAGYDAMVNGDPWIKKLD